VDLKRFFRQVALPAITIASGATKAEGDKTPTGDAVLYRQLREQLVGIESRNPNIHAVAGYLNPVGER
jgi:hypothetical protein